MNWNYVYSSLVTLSTARKVPLNRAQKNQDSEAETEGSSEFNTPNQTSDPPLSTII